MSEGTLLAAFDDHDDPALSTTFGGFLHTQLQNSIETYSSPHS